MQGYLYEVSHYNSEEDTVQLQPLNSEKEEIFSHILIRKLVMEKFQ